MNELNRLRSASEKRMKEGNDNIKLEIINQK